MWKLSGAVDDDAHAAREVVNVVAVEVRDLGYQLDLAIDAREAPRRGRGPWARPRARLARCTVPAGGGW